MLWHPIPLYGILPGGYPTYMFRRLGGTKNGDTAFFLRDQQLACGDAVPNALIPELAGVRERIVQEECMPVPETTAIDALARDLVAGRVGRRQFIVRRLPGLGAAQYRQSVGATEEVGNPVDRIGLNDLAQRAKRAIDRNAAGVRRKFAGDQLQKRGFPDAVAADKPGPFDAETQIKIGE